MSMKVTRENIAELDARIVAPEELRPETKVARNFDLPPVLHMLTVGCYLAVIGVFAALFGNAELLIPMVIFVVSVIAGFGVPALWTQMKPDHSDRALDWGTFEARGIATLTGVLSAKDATVQVLMLPLFILGWAITIAIIVAFV